MGLVKAFLGLQYTLTSPFAQFYFFPVPSGMNKYPNECPAWQTLSVSASKDIAAAPTS